MPDELLLASVSSIPKDVRSDMCNSDNYRGIALSSCLSKIHDIIVLRKYSNLLCTSEMQYAFKSEHGTTMCTLALKEVSKYYMRNGSDEFVGKIDASKAFDRLCHEKLFNILIKRNVPAVVIRILLDSYRRQKMLTVWNGYLSGQFGILNGVKQGGIASPVLFTIYMDILLKHLETCGAGCMVGNSYFGALSYADDLAILSPTITGLQLMLNECQKFGDEYGVCYNPTKVFYSFENFFNHSGFPNPGWARYNKNHSGNFQVRELLCGKIVCFFLFHVSSFNDDRLIISEDCLKQKKKLIF
jgi:hypothetical protein